MSHFNISRNDAIYQTSFEGNDYLAIENSRRIIKEEKNIYASIIAANLLIHRAKNVDTGFKLYDLVINCSSTYNYLDILIQALDYKWRMIHHHPSLVKRPLEEALQIVEKIRSYQPEYTNTELVIMYDFTLNDNEKAEQEYIKLIQNKINFNTIDNDEFWLFNQIAVKLLYLTFKLKILFSNKSEFLLSSNLPDTYSLSNTCKNLNFNPKYQCKFIDSNEHTIYFYDEILDQIISNFITPKYFNVAEKVDLLCSYMYFSIKLREPIKFEKSIKDFIHSEDVVPISELFSLEEEFNISILTTISNIVAGSYPELALYILKEELNMFNFNDTDYAVKDFMLDPSEELKGNEYLAEDFVPELCLN